ncbi:MAG: hypothetical protein JXJ20_09975 [Anaerolineae bacterium]|nr:hypothetical protein [Anaerolineae bacterium]
MKTRYFAVIVVLALCIGGLATVSAAPTPTIITFESSLKSITVNNAESGDLTTTLTWHTVGLTTGYRLALSSYQQNQWVPVFGPSSVPLEPKGARVVTIRHPLNFGPPTFLLSIEDGSSRIVEQRTLTIPYAPDPDVPEPVIDALEADTDSLDADALAAGQAIVTLTWDVDGRLAGSNLVFEQVLSDNSAVSVELPRSNLWIPSSGHGPVAPILEQGADAVTLRLQVIDVVSGNVYDEQELVLDIIGAVPVTEAAGHGAAEETGATQPAPVPPPGNLITSFTTTPTTVNPGAPVSLAWEVQGTGGVTIEQTVPGIGAVETVVTAQSPQGSATVYLPDYAAYSVTYTLWTANRSASAQVVVSVHCPYAFFFGQGDGCPSTPAREVQAAYQPFEGGYMIWRGDTQEVYVHYDDGEYRNGSAAYYLEATYEGMAESSPEKTPPLDRHAPIRGFGRVWTNAPGVADKLGWGLAPEEGYMMTIQQVAMTREPRPEFMIYLTLPDGSVVGSGFGRWQFID